MTQIIKTPIDRSLMLAVAWLRSAGVTQEEIASQLDINQSRVSRLLHAAVAEEILTCGPIFQRHYVKDEEWQLAEEKYFGHRNLNKWLAGLRDPKLHFKLTVLAGDYNEFANAAAKRVLELLTRSKRVGVMWGRTVLKLIESMKRQPDASAARRASVPDCIPLCGDPIHLMNLGEVEHSASYLAAELEDVLKGSRKEDLPCLAGVPAYVSPSLLKSEAFEKFLHSIPGYQEIFAGGKEHHRLVNVIDTVITGIGIMAGPASREHDTAAFIRERLAQEAYTKEQLNELIIGDLGGLLLEKPKLTAQQRKIVQNLNDGWIGITFDTFERITKQATKNGAPGMIVLAFGAQKAEMVIEIVRRGLVNELVIDVTLAAALNKKFDPKTGQLLSS